MKKLPSHPPTRARKVACTVSAAALMLGVSNAATVGLKFTVNYCGFGNYVNYVNSPAFGIAVDHWENLTPMGTGYSSCSSTTFFSLTEVIDTTTSSPPGGLYPLPNGSVTVSWSGPTANWSGFAGYDAGSAGQPNPAAAPGRGEAEVYAGFIRDGVNFGPGSSGGDNNQPGYSIDIVGLKSLFTNTPFVIQLVAAADSMQDLTNAFIIDATHSTTQSVIYPKPQAYGNVGDTAWYRAIGGGISTVSGSVNADHVKIIGNRAQHVANPGGFNHGSTISGAIITDKPVVTMSPQPVKCGPHDDVNLRAIAAGVPPLSYQWRKGGVPIANATNASYSISNILASASYDLVVTNLYGSATSKVSAVTVDQLRIAYQPFVLDSKPSGTPINGLDFGAATWLASSTDSAGTNRAGVMAFNSSHPDQIQLPGVTNFDSTAGTILFWMRSAGTNGTGNEGAILFDRSTSSGFVIVQEGDGTVLVRSAGTAFFDMISASLVSDNNWHEIAVTYDQTPGAGVALYVDGTQQIIRDNLAWSWPVGQPIELGHSHTASWMNYNGLLDDVRIYNRVLTAPEIATVHSSGSLVDTTALQVRLNFDARPAPGIWLTWADTGAVLQSANAVTGPYTDVTPAATSPYYVMAQSAAKFYRYRRTAVSINSNPYDM